MSAAASAPSGIVEHEGGVCVPAGFFASGVSAGIKKSGGLDLALLVSDRPAAVAGVFTTNLAAAPPVSFSRDRIKEGSSRGVVINSGCANACTGSRGMTDAAAMANAAAELAGAGSGEMLVCSTGLIGSFLPMENVHKGIEDAAAALAADDDNASRAIMTTDTFPKRACFRNPEGWSIGGMAKGAGMIAPNMATMLAFVTSDANLPAAALSEALAEAVETTFNSISVDGDSSTNDTVLLFANGSSGVEVDPGAFSTALQLVCATLARMIVDDGEGTSRVMRVSVSGAADSAAARLAARAVAESNLVKTAVYGADANWGRVVAALGRSGAAFDPGRLSVSIAGVVLCDRGVGTGQDAVLRARAGMQARQIDLECDLGEGRGSAQMLSTDLTPEYVQLNAAYES